MSEQRAQAFCLPDPHIKLLEALRAKNIERFWNILQYSDVSCDQWYDDPYYATLLEITCKNVEYHQFVAALLECGADPNVINPVRKVTPLHVAAEVGNYQALQALVSSPKTNLNAVDSYGNTALHICAKLLKPDSEIYERCISLLINQPKIQINIVNRKGLTALHMIVLNGSSAIVHELIKNTKHIYNIDTFRGFDGRTTREIIVQKFPELKEFLPSLSSSLKEEDTEVTVLFQYLYNNDCESFVSTIQNKNAERCQKLINKSDGRYTFLQLACEKGQTEAVKILLETGANPLIKTDSCKWTPAMIAAYNGYYHILEWFIFYRTKNFVDSSSETILHATVQGFNSKPSLNSSTDRDHGKCLRLLLDNMKDLKLDINQVDSKGNSALHYAARNDDENSVFTLLSHGAYIGSTNLFKEMPIQFMSAETLERFLDSCLETNGESTREENFEISFKYNFLSPPLDLPTKEEMSSKRRYQIPHIAETKPLLYISQSKELKQLLKHPIIISFLFLKWLQIRKYYYYNITFYCFFVLLLTVHIFLDYTSSLPSDTKQNSWSLHMIFANLTMLFPMLVFREIFQLMLSPRRYFLSMENYLELILIGISAEILYPFYSDKSLKQPISAIAILLSWSEMILLIGRHPSLSTNIEMLKRVSLNFLKFLMWYAILILAFALSFYVLFRGCHKSQCDDDDEEENFFNRPTISIFKTILMITGEFEASSIPFSSFPGTSHVIFILFVFLITIVLYNLLNGLAVSDTQRIKNEAELVSYASRVNLIFHFETVFLCKLAKCMNQMNEYCCFDEKYMVWSKLIRREYLFPVILPDKMIRVFPNQNSIIVFTTEYKKVNDRSCNNRCKDTVMDAEILESAMEILCRKKKITLFDIKERLDSTEIQLKNFQKHLEDYERRLKRYGPRFDSIDDSWKQAEEKMDRVLRWLETVSNKNHSSLSGSDS